MRRRLSSGEWTFDEGCLSVPGLYFPITRPKDVHLLGCDLDGQPVDIEASEFHARVLQHEVDHLDGILYPRRIRDLTQFGFNDALFPGENLADD